MKMIECLMNPVMLANQKQQNFIDEAFLNVDSTAQEFTSLFDFYLQSYKRLVYKKYDQDLNDPVQVGTRRYFASIVFDLKAYLKSDGGGKKSANAPLNQNITFDAQFESGNLFCAFERSPNEYELVLQNDINSKGHTQWFFFAVRIKQRGVYRFSIVNLMKSGSLFSQGMQPVCYSEVGGKFGWCREGKNITYAKNGIRKEGSFKDKCYYTLSFSMNFKHDNDTIWIAHSYPYTFTQLSMYLNDVFENNHKNKFVNRKTLCKTIAGNKCDVITITSASLKQRSMRRGFLLMARQHPGEPQGSYMIEGVLDFLLGDTLEAQYIRSAAVVKIIPMVNIDGVVVGNYRCSLAGCDPNRRWKNPKKRIHPEALKIKELIKNFNRERQVRLVCDFHGHSRKLSAFFYGCISTHQNKYLNPRIFPYMMSQLSTYVSFPLSTFGIQKGKESTARVRIYQEMRIPLVYTLEASFYGYAAKRNKGVQCAGDEFTHFTIQDYKDIGRQFCYGLYKILYDDVGPLENDGLEKSSSSPLKFDDHPINIKDMAQELMNEIGHLNLEDNEQSQGSDTDVSEDNLEDEYLINILPTCSLNKKQKKISDQLKEKQAKKDLLAAKKATKEPPQKVERPKSLQKERQVSNWMLDRKKKKEPLKEDINNIAKIMVDKAMQTDEKMYKQLKIANPIIRDWLRSQQLEKARSIVQSSIIQPLNQKQFMQTISQKNFLGKQPSPPNLQFKLSIQQPKGSFNLNHPIGPQQQNKALNYYTNKEDFQQVEFRMRQLRSQSAARKKVAITQETIIKSNNMFINSNEQRRTAQGRSRQDSFSDHIDVSASLVKEAPQKRSQQDNYLDFQNLRNNIAKAKYKW